MVLQYREACRNLQVHNILYTFLMSWRRLGALRVWQERYWRRTLSNTAYEFYHPNSGLMADQAGDT